MLLQNGFILRHASVLALNYKLVAGCGGVGGGLGAGEKRNSQRQSKQRFHSGSLSLFGRKQEPRDREDAGQMGAARRIRSKKT
jgi:hypothetical protein